MAAAMTMSSGAIGAAVTLTTPIRNALVVRVMAARDMNAVWMNGKEIGAVKALGDKAPVAVRINGKAAVAARTLADMAMEINATGARATVVKVPVVKAMVVKATVAVVVAV